MIQVKDNVYWLGLRDWDLRRFHGHELSTHVVPVITHILSVMKKYTCRYRLESFSGRVS